MISRLLTSFAQLKPDATGGLFKHGRASAQVAGCGAGCRCCEAQCNTAEIADMTTVPDLIFNEMRFLQKPKLHQDEVPTGGDVHGLTKKRKDRPDEAISAYFAAQESDKDSDPGVQRGTRACDRLESRPEQQPARRPRPDVSGPPVQLPDKPFLGFGSKGVQQASGDAQGVGDSYYTWSDSGAPTCRERTSKGQLSSRDASKGMEETVIISRQPEKPSKTRKTIRPEPRDDSYSKSHGQGARNQARRTRDPALAGGRKPSPPSQALDHREWRSETKTTSQSLPDGEPVQHTKGPLDVERSESYHTSGILDLGDLVRDRMHVPPRQNFNEEQAECDHGRRSEEPRSSTPTAKLLRKAKHAVSHQSAV